MSLSLPSKLALPLTVWAIYLADRLLDSLNSHHQTARHAFYREHRVVGLSLLIAVSMTLAVTLHFLPPLVLQNGLILGAVVALYMLAVHALPHRLRRYFPKELAVALVFSAGTNLSIWTRMQNPERMLIPAFCFALLCWLNCSAIERWENFLPSALRLTPFAITICFLSCSLIIFTPWHFVLAAVAICSLTYCWLEQSKNSWNADAVRVFADLPLLLPVLMIIR